MSRIKLALISSTAGLLVTAAAVGNAYAAPDGQEQARQLLQRSEAKTEQKPVIVLVRAVAQGGDEQARRMIEGHRSVAEEGGQQLAGVRLIAKSAPVVDGHTAAGNLLARSLGSKSHSPHARRVSARTEAASKNAGATKTD